MVEVVVGVGVVGEVVGEVEVVGVVGVVVGGVVEVVVSSRKEKEDSP